MIGAAAWSAKAYIRAVNAALGALRRFMWPRRRPSSVRRICVHRVGRIGDLVTCLPALRMIREAYPGAEMVLLSSPGARGEIGARDLFANIGWIDRVWMYSREEVRTVTGMLDFARKLRREEFDAWFELPPSLTYFTHELRNMAFVRLLGVPWATGFRVSSTRRLARALALGTSFLPEWRRQEDHLRRAGLGDTAAAAALEIPERDRRVVDDMVREGGSEGRPLLGVAPGARREANRWPLGRFVAVTRKWLAAGGSAVVVGGDGERQVGRLIAEQCGVGVLDLCGRTTVLQTAEMLGRCRVTLANDSGPMHLAAAMRVPCVVAFSARDYAGKWLPWGDGHTIIRSEIECSPCFLDTCPRDNECLARIGVEEVWAAVAERAGDGMKV